jgi:BirA family transcriptional regulator, biotin operon repressor / biotin---[acetyl-CoA-carboxylase] ligase
MKRLEPKILRYESLPSTNTEAARLALQGADEGLSIIADEQTAGRGRLQRNWISPKGAGLYLSIVLRPEIPLIQWPLLTFMAAVAVNDALLKACRLQTEIKWPNDILSNERKLCGILSEAIETDEGRAAVTGIGINLTAEAFPAELAGVAISVEEATHRKPDPEVILAALLDALVSRYSTLHQIDGPAKTLQAWTGRSSYGEGKRVKIVNGEEVVQGITRGLEEDGALRVETDTDGIRIIRAGDVVSLRSS